LRRTVIAGDDDLPTFAARVSGLTTRVNSLRRKSSEPGEFDTPMVYVRSQEELDV